MCGLAGKIGGDVHSFLNKAIKTMEYRGYDSWGKAYRLGEHICYEKNVGRFDESKLKQNTFSPSLGICHTRWATTGRVSIENAHPILEGKYARTAVVHNGVITNYVKLKEKLEKLDYKFYYTQTDTEVAANYFDYFLNNYPGGLKSGLKEILLDLKGSSAYLVLTNLLPDRIFFMTTGQPLYVAPGHAASDINVLSDCCSAVYDLSDKNVVGWITQDRVNFVDCNNQEFKTIGVPSKKTSVIIPDNQHNMFSEICEQPNLIRTSINPKTNMSKWPPIFFGCGSSYYAGQFGKRLFEYGQCEYSTDITESTLNDEKYYVALTQSGETKDTLIALNHLKKNCHYINEDNILVVTNNADSAAAKYGGVIDINCGPEKAVAATKSFTMQVVKLLEIAGLLHEADKLSLGDAMDFVLNSENIDNSIQKLAKELINYNHFLCLGRGLHYPIVLEGALKIKEVAYKHAEAMPANEIKHGGLALVDDKTVSILILTKQDENHVSKIMENFNEIKCRNGKILTICDEETYNIIRGISDWVIKVPYLTSVYTQPLLVTLVFQLLAYYMSTSQGINPDYPRNLSKCVTV